MDQNKGIKIFYTLTRSRNLASSSLIKEAKGVALGRRTLPFVLGVHMGMLFSSKNFAFLGEA